MSLLRCIANGVKMHLPVIRAVLLSAASVIALTSAAEASERIVYTYDALGRLTRVVHSGTVNDGVQAGYAYDAADNRSNVTVSPAKAAPSPPAATIWPSPTDDTGSPGQCAADSVAGETCPLAAPAPDDPPPPDGGKRW